MFMFFGIFIGLSQWRYCY